MTTAEIETVLGNEDLRQLLDTAEQAGTVRQVELAEVLEPLELDELELEALQRELEQRGIDVLLDEEKAPERTPEPAPQPVFVETTTDALQLFLREAGRHALLTAAQEVELAKRIERGDTQAKQRMIQSNLLLVVRSPRITATMASLFDLSQEGPGPVRAVAKFAGAAASSLDLWPLYHEAVARVCRHKARRQKPFTCRAPEAHKLAISGNLGRDPTLEGLRMRPAPIEQSRG